VIEPIQHSSQGASGQVRVALFVALADQSEPTSFRVDILGECARNLVENLYFHK
jgi:hypothetical protein